MPEMPMTVTDRENQPLERRDFEPRRCPYCNDLIDDPTDWWEQNHCCLVCGFFTSAEERDQFNAGWGKP